MAVLIGISGAIRGKTFDLSNDEVSVGRRDENDITLDDSSVSGNHAQIARQDETWLLRDLGSTNGTRVNGQSVGETLLVERDQVQFGSVQLVYTEVDPDTFDLNDLTELSDDFDIEVTAELAQAPTTFSSHSPFEAHKKQKKGVWNIILILIGIVALIGVCVLFYLLFVAG